MLVFALDLFLVQFLDFFLRSDASIAIVRLVRDRLVVAVPAGVHSAAPSVLRVVGLGFP